MMLKLAQADQQKAHLFIETQARPLEQSLFAYYFQAGSRDAIFAELAKFQNPDGGFGRALEPDLRLPDSSVIATTVALKHMRELDADSDHPLVQSAICYLLDVYDAERKVWPIAPSNTEDAPRAPWWSDVEGFDWRANPTAEVVGYLFDYAELVPANVREMLLESVVIHLENQPDDMEMHSLLCYLSLANTKALPDVMRARILRQLESMVMHMTAQTSADWGKYLLMPLKVVPVPDAPFAEMLADAIELNLDYEIGRQGDDGAWTPTWSWGDNFPDVWDVAKREWSGRLTVDALKTLRGFGRLE